MRDATAYGGGGFYTPLAKAVMRGIPPAGSIIDAGCGTGDLAMALARADASSRVYAADLSLMAIASINNCPSNMQTMLTDVFSLPARQKFDSAVFCRFGKLDECLDFARVHVNKSLIMVKRNDDAHLFSLNAADPAVNTYEESLSTLAERGIPCQAQPITLSLDQPFRDMADALTFFKFYGRTDCVSVSEVRSRVEATGKKDFPFVVRGVRKLGIIIIDVKKLNGGL